MWGHATTYCARLPKCLHCGDNHLSTTCNKDRQIKCANCQGQHTSNSQTCPVYTYKYNKLTQHINSNPRRYNNAPQPTTNPWKKNISRANGDNKARASGPALTHENFPKLTRQHSNRQHPPTPDVQHPGVHENSQNTDPVSDLLSTMGKLQNIDISEMLRFLDDLLKISEIKDHTQKCKALIVFASNFNNYNF